MTSIDVNLVSSLSTWEYLTPSSSVSIVTFQQETVSFDARSPSLPF